MKNKKVAGQPALLKQINRNRIIQLIIKQGEISRSELAKSTELALPSVMRLVEGLITDGLVIDIGKGTSSGGRRPNLVTLNKEAMYIVGVEIAIESSVVIADLMGNIIDKWHSHEMPDETPEQRMENILLYVTTLIQKHQIPMDKIAGIGIGTPGSNFKYSRSIPRTILKGWETINVKAWFENKVSYPVFVDNVARTRTLSELWFGAGKALQNFIYVFVDQGVGCGFVKNGHVVLGHDDVAGEFGHTVIEIDGRPCYCGSDGCLEMYVSAGAIINEVNQVIEEELNTLSDLVRYQDNEAVNKILEYSGKVLGVGISNLINLYNPEAIIIGGRVPTEVKSLLTSTNMQIKPHVFSKSAEQTAIMISLLKDEEEGIGGVALVYNELFKSIVM